MVEAYRPETLSEALEILAEKSCTIMAGGTDLMVQKARGFALQPIYDLPLLFINHLDELQNITIENNEIHIGAGAVLTDIINSYLIPDTFKEVIGQMASPPTRNLATIGGNIVNASPAGDTLPYLYAVNATVELQSAGNNRILSINEFITAPKTTILQKNELLTNIIIPNREFDFNIYRKLGQRKGMSLTKAAFHGLANIADDNITDIRMALGSVAPRIVRSVEFEKMIIGKSINDIPAMIPLILEKYAELIKPIDDARSTAKYRKDVSLRMIDSFLRNDLTPGTQR
ncbi:MAG: FAD binding domain-containing protein [Fidelibacterota bacterium]